MAGDLGPVQPDPIYSISRLKRDQPKNNDKQPSRDFDLEAEATEVATPEPTDDPGRDAAPIGHRDEDETGGELDVTG